jgi:aminoglycoside phosphotransferase family enzyme
MVRFEENGLFDRMAEDGRLTSRLVRDLADRIAEFHDGAEVDRRAGGAAAMAKVIDGNEMNLRESSAGFDQARLDQLLAAWRQSLASLAAILDRRRAEGHVRLCHGDLHLRNICLVRGRPTLFDCVEFNDEIARIDVLYDLAFLIMDLHSRQLDGLENQVFNRYLDIRDETDGLAAFPLFLSLRAVSCFAGTPSGCGGRSERHRQNQFGLCNRPGPGARPRRTRLAQRCAAKTADGSGPRDPAWA